MVFELDKAIEILERTPASIETLLHGISNEWLMHNEGDNTWSPYEIIGHLIHGEKTDWIPRAKIILSQSQNKTFEPFDRFAQNKQGQTKTISELLKEFKKLRAENIKELLALNIDKLALKKTGIHPELGEVNLQELLSTWVVHDLGHIAQISRVMAKQYKDEVGVWQAYLGILKK
ncbi:DinB family protein [Flagellimonas meridianipacifica]|uniref:DinB family protein n=1 Tax=Flagellimonas meridianipacifica TaxID=1080225 RepID=A0A2T0MFU5_9FLAO|nr:DinB family protein [Allomuricauda pacifica]PRX56450.1 DinB family protein [Allomuricauda pacifica]